MAVRILQMPWHAQGAGRASILYRLSLVLLLLLVVLEAEACSSSPSPPPPLSVLHLPGVVQLNAVADMEARTGDRVIKSILTYHRLGETATTHILYLGGSGLYEIQLDGSGLRQIQMQPPCYFLGAIDPRGKYGLCWNAYGVQAFDLDDPASSWRPRVLVSTSFATSEALISPTMAPDGQHFAALHKVGSELAGAINVYAIDDSMTVATLVATISLPGLHARRLVWSPDGKWLAFTTDESTPSSVVGATYVFTLASILPTLPKQGSQPLQVALSKTQLTKLVDSPHETNAWRPSRAEPIWTYVEAGAIWQVGVLSGKRTAILTIPDGNICAFVWTPDGKQVVFAQCREDGLSESPPARLYVYTLPAT
jgi:WD40 repeat protein